MSGDVNNIMAQLAVIEREIFDPVRNVSVIAYENIPYTIASADMPLFVNFVGNLSQSVVAGSDDQARDFNDTRNFVLTLYHSPYASGVEGEKMGLLTPYFPLVYNKFGSYPHLKMLGGILDAKLIGDSGMTVVTFAGNQYFGVKFTLQVISKVRRLLGDYE